MNEPSTLSPFGMAKAAAGKLPHRWQQELKRLRFQRQIRRGTFITDEPEWKAVEQWLSPGDWAVDVGANVGHYTKRFSDLTGPRGRVIAFEPVSATFELLAANAARFEHSNVTLLNAAASDATRVLGIDIPMFDSGLTNYYQAALTSSATARLQVMTLSIDSLGLPSNVKLLKIDAEGHDAVVLQGAQGLLERARPTLIIESVSPAVHERLEKLGYSVQKLPGSPNVVYRP